MIEVGQSILQSQQQLRGEDVEVLRWGRYKRHIMSRARFYQNADAVGDGSVDRLRRTDTEMVWSAGAWSVDFAGIRTTLPKYPDGDTFIQIKRQGASPITIFVDGEGFREDVGPLGVESVTYPGVLNGGGDLIFSYLDGRTFSKVARYDAASIPAEILFPMDIPDVSGLSLSSASMWCGDEVVKISMSYELRDGVMCLVKRVGSIPEHWVGDVFADAQFTFGVVTNTTASLVRSAINYVAGWDSFRQLASNVLGSGPTPKIVYYAQRFFSGGVFRNQHHRVFFSFDTSSLAPETVISASLSVSKGLTTTYAASADRGDLFVTRFTPTTPGVLPAAGDSNILSTIGNPATVADLTDAVNVTPIVFGGNPAETIVAPLSLTDNVGPIINQTGFTSLAILMRACLSNTVPNGTAAAIEIGYNPALTIDTLDPIVGGLLSRAGGQPRPKGVGREPVRKPFNIGFRKMGHKRSRALPTTLGPSPWTVLFQTPGWIFSSGALVGFADTAGAVITFVNPGVEVDLFGVSGYATLLPQAAMSLGVYTQSSDARIAYDELFSGGVGIEHSAQAGHFDPLTGNGFLAVSISNPSGGFYFVGLVEVVGYVIGAILYSTSIPSPARGLWVKAVENGGSTDLELRYTLVGSPGPGDWILDPSFVVTHPSVVDGIGICAAGVTGSTAPIPLSGVDTTTIRRVDITDDGTL